MNIIERAAAVAAAGEASLRMSAVTHGGDDFEKIANLVALLGFTASSLSAMKSCPYHLAIGNEPHDDNIDMASHAWMQREEAAFLGEPASVSKPKTTARSGPSWSGLGSIVSASIAGSTAAATLSS